MAQKTVVTLIDDLDESEADETVEFGIDGVSYEIDLSDTNASGLRDAFASYIANARRTAGRRNSARWRSATAGTSRGTRTATGSTSADREQNKAIRDWARTQGYEVSERGRIPGSVVTAFHSQR